MKEYIITDDFLDDLTMKFASAQGQLKELIRCKDCIKKELCSIFRDAKQELGFCAWAGRKEE